MSEQRTQYEAAWRRARVHRNLHGPEGFGPGMLAASLRSEWSRKGYTDGWCSQDADEADVSFALAAAGDMRA